MSQKTRGEIAEREIISIGFSNFLHLFDEQWFFCNALIGDLSVTKQSLHESPAAAETEVPPSRDRSDGGGDGDSGPRNYCSGGKLRYSYSALDDTVRQSISSSSSSKASTEQSTGRRRPPRTEPPHSRCPNPHLLMCWEASNRKVFQSKKWRSFGDLETMELQGFKDLGFVFDEREGLSSSLVRVIPALRERKEEEEDGEQKRLYLPEGWFAQRSAPPVVLRRVSCCSGEEMKEQLRFWARSVACNVRRDC